MNVLAGFFHSRCFDARSVRAVAIPVRAAGGEETSVAAHCLGHIHGGIGAPHCVTMVHGLLAQNSQVCPFIKRALTAMHQDSASTPARLILFGNNPDLLVNH